MYTKRLLKYRFRSKNFKSRQILKQKFYNDPDFELKFLQRVTLWIKTFTTRQILKKEMFIKGPILKKSLHTKNHVLVQFTP